MDCNTKTSSNTERLVGVNAAYHMFRLKHTRGHGILSDMKIYRSDKFIKILFNNDVN